MIVYTHDLLADRRLDVSFVLDVFAGGINHDGLEMGGIYTGLGSACRFSVEHACVLTTNDGFSMVHRRYKTTSLRDTGVIVSRPA